MKNYNKVLIIWDQSFLGEGTQKNDILKQYFLNRLKSVGPFFSSLEIDDLDLITDESELIGEHGELGLKVRAMYYRAVVVLAELNWAGKPITTYLGIEMVRQIRLAGWRCPIFICSHLDREYFLKMGKLSFQVLKCPGHEFISLPKWQLKDIEKARMEPISQYLLDDMRYHCLNLEGFVDEAYHSMKNGVPFSYRKSIETGFRAISKVIPWERKWQDQLMKIQTEMLLKLKNVPENGQIKVLMESKEEVMSLLLPEKQRARTHCQNHHWGILYIDDDLQHRIRVQKEFKQRGLHCFVASRGEEALKLLERDILGELVLPGKSRPFPKNFICILVSDLRIQDEMGVWDHYQGYDIIKEAHAKSQNALKYFILTSKKEGILKFTSSSHPAKIEWYTKDMVLLSEGGFEPFSERVIEVGNETFDSLCNQPKNTSWRSGSNNKVNEALGNYYRFYRASGKYSEWELEVNERAMIYLKQAEWIKEKGVTEKEGLSKVLEDLQLTTTISERAGVTDLESEMEKFVNILIGRRVAIGLHLMGWKIKDISAVLSRNGNLDGNDDINYPLLTTFLALSAKIETVVPFQLLVEEKAWVEFDLGMSLEHGRNPLYDRFNDLILELQEFDYPSMDSEIQATEYFTEKLTLKNKAEVEKYLRFFAHHCQTNQKAKKHFLRGLDRLFEKRAYRRAINRYALIDSINWIKQSLNTEQ